MLKSRTNLIARTLSGAWRCEPTAPGISVEDLESVAPLLNGSGAGALAWCRIRNSELRSTSVAFQLHQAYRKHTLEAALHEMHIKESFALLRSNGIEPVLVKGWGIARFYPERGMRPYDDVDLVVPAEHYAPAEAIIDQAENLRGHIDLHKGVSEVDPLNDEDELFANSQLVTLGDVDVRVLRPEDSLRALCLHLLRHGAFRPLWLCDIAVAVESRQPEFDWDLCLGRSHRAADWVACTIGLANQLLGARVDDTPVATRAKNLPSWLIPSVLKQWKTPFSKNHGTAKHVAQMFTYLRHPSGVLKDLTGRWPDPIQATVYVGGPFNEIPRFPFQIGECIGRTAKFIARLPKALRNGA
jgi:putative nucleotidyltransferase-like protein